MLTALVAVPAMLLAQQPSIYYVYDDLNRLVVVVDRLGNAATYTYDAVGNILRIDRFDASGLPGAVAISLFVPSAGKVGTSVQVFGKGLAPNSMLSFAGRPATITDAAANRVMTTVPPGATTGPLSVTSAVGSATSAATFRVLGVLAVTPATVQVSVPVLRVTARVKLIFISRVVNTLPAGMTELTAQPRAVSSRVAAKPPCAM